MKKIKSLAIIICLMVTAIVFFVMVYDQKYAVAMILLLLVLPACMNKKFWSDVVGF